MNSKINEINSISASMGMQAKYFCAPICGIKKPGFIEILNPIPGLQLKTSIPIPGQGLSVLNAGSAAWDRGIQMEG
jgi:hypothetical protein